MLRLFQLLAILIPLTIYLVYVYSQRRRAAAAGADLPSWYQSGPAFWAVMGGVLMIATTLIGWALMTGAPPGSVYVPERVIDGEVIDAEMVQPDG